MTLPLPIRTRPDFITLEDDRNGARPMIVRLDAIESVSPYEVGEPYGPSTRITLRSGGTLVAAGESSRIIAIVREAYGD